MQGHLLTWYSQNKRDLPWRKKALAYEVWLAEIVFQQTRIVQGMPYYQRLLKRFPTVLDLARADEQEVLKYWEGLGYYSRARNLHYSAKQIVSDFNGVFPSTYKEILKLKGVGPYTAAAIASVSFSEAIAAVDGNVLRVSARLFAIEEEINKVSTQKMITGYMQELIPQNHPGDFNQAMMELGAMICTPKQAKCHLCPIQVYCRAFEDQIQDRLPNKEKRGKVKDLYFNYIIGDNDHIYLHKRNDGIWKELYQFPLIESEKSLSMEALLDLLEESPKKVRESEEYIHLLSHRRIHVKFWMMDAEDPSWKNKYQQARKEEIRDYPLPRAITRFLESEEAVAYGLA